MWMTEIIDAKETARLLGMSISYFYKLRSIAPNSLPPAVETMGGRKVRAYWTLSIVMQWLQLQHKRAEKMLIEQKQSVEQGLKSIQIQRSARGRPRHK
jgi:predicted DNA-binding transcriptional regulator AlpA